MTEGKRKNAVQEAIIIMGEGLTFYSSKFHFNEHNVFELLTKVQQKI